MLTDKCSPALVVRLGDLPLTARGLRRVREGGQPAVIPFAALGLEVQRFQVQRHLFYHILFLVVHLQSLCEVPFSDL